MNQNASNIDFERRFGTQVCHFNGGTNPIGNKTMQSFKNQMTKYNIFHLTDVQT